jgi:hypothetical protein
MIQEQRSVRVRRVALWVVAVAAMVAAAAFQRLTGPTYALRGEVRVAGAPLSYRLPRKGWTYEDLRVTIPDPGPETTGWLFYKRFKTGDSLTAIPLQRDTAGLFAELPRQPAAGKLEYAVILQTAGERVRLPAGDDDVVARFKDDVPLWLLLPHVFFMFFAVLFGMRAGLSAVFEPERMARHAWVSLGLMTAGGMILGPIVQHYAFGAFWTGFPFGYDLTDNKTLLMWGVWVGACGLLAARARALSVRRAAVVAATVVMTGVYLIPHSTRGSELDYELLDQGVPASEAVTEG